MSVEEVGRIAVAEQAQCAFQHEQNSAGASNESGHAGKLSRFGNGFAQKEKSYRAEGEWRLAESGGCQLFARSRRSQLTKNAPVESEFTENGEVAPATFSPIRRGKFGGGFPVWQTMFVGHVNDKFPFDVPAVSWSGAVRL